MRLAEPAAVFKYERLKLPYVGVTADSVTRLFIVFFRFNGYRRQKSTTELKPPNSFGSLLSFRSLHSFRSSFIKMRLAPSSLGAARLLGPPPAVQEGSRDGRQRCVGLLPELRR